MYFCQNINNWNQPSTCNRKTILVSISKQLVNSMSGQKKVLLICKIDLFSLIVSIIKIKVEHPKHMAVIYLWTIEINKEKIIFKNINFTYKQYFLCIRHRINYCFEIPTNLVAVINGKPWHKNKGLALKKKRAQSRVRKRKVESFCFIRSLRDSNKKVASQFANSLSTLRPFFSPF